ncbi:ATP-dependent DNA helicase [Plasmodiophora brassicae]
MYYKVETERLRYIERHQHVPNGSLRNDEPHNLDMNANRDRFVRLPPSFIGGPRNMFQRYLNTCAMKEQLGPPAFLITMTANPDWKEVRSSLRPGQRHYDRPDIVARVFRMKVRRLIAIVKGQFGTYLGYVYVVEFQKRGLPHIHMLLWLSQRLNIHDYDRYVSAEIPPPSNARLRDLVTRHMLHTCRADRCLDAAGKCRRGFPKQFSPMTTLDLNEIGDQYRRRHPSHGGETFTSATGTTYNNSQVVPYNPYLLLRLNCHINVEIITTHSAIKYLFMYMHKGTDRTSFRSIMGDPDNPDHQNEIDLFQDARYLSSSEAAWRLFGIPMHDSSHSCEILPVHLLGREQYVNDRKLTSSFDTVQHETGNPLPHEMLNGGPPATDLTYAQMPLWYRWNTSTRTWTRRSRRNATVVSRLYNILPAQGELYYLRLLLHRVPRVPSFEFLLHFNGHRYDTFQDAAIARNLCRNDTDWIECMAEASTYATPTALRNLFVTILLSRRLTNATLFWQTFRDALSADFAFSRNQRSGRNPPQRVVPCTDNDCYVKSMLQSAGRSGDLRQYGLPSIADDDNDNVDRLFTQYLLTTYPNTTMEQLRHQLEADVSTLNRDQRILYDEISESIDTRSGHIYYLQAGGGCGKTFPIRTLILRQALQHQKSIVCATSGMAANLLPGGKRHTRLSEYLYPCIQTPNPEMPPYRIPLKVGCIYILLRNMLGTPGLQNGIRVILLGQQRHLLHVRIVTGPYTGNTAFLPRITFAPNDESRLAIKFTRLQFPIRLGFAVTISKAQGQTITGRVGVYLPMPVFGHGMLYVALSRVGNPAFIRVCLE